MRIFAQKIWPSPEGDSVRGRDKEIPYRAQERLMQAILGEDAEIVWGYNDDSTYSAATLGMQFLNNAGILRSILEAERQECDAVLITCGNDPVIHEARDLLRIPVVSVTESAVLLGLTLGRRYGVITLDDQSPVLVERNLAGYQLLERAISHRPIRSADLVEPVTPWFADRDYLFESVIPRFEAVAHGLIADGAEVIVAACGNFSAFSVHGYSRVTGTEVPVVDALTAGTHLAGVMARLHADLGVRTSKAGAYRGPSPETRAARLETFLQRHRADAAG